jgi:hypothetical protein
VGAAALGVGLVERGGSGEGHGRVPRIVLPGQGDADVEPGDARGVGVLGGSAIGGNRLLRATAIERRVALADRIPAIGGGR